MRKTPLAAHQHGKGLQGIVDRSLLRCFRSAARATFVRRRFALSVLTR
jgi:hypothetical protein